MPLFSIKTTPSRLKRKDFRNEKELQNFIECNMETLLNIRFLASEFATSTHGGRIDSLGLDETNAPVIIEYKWGEKDNIINQGLFYLDWLVDHPGDFQILVQKKLGTHHVHVDFSSPRVVLIAQTFNKYDHYAINRMAENIELWEYSRYEEDLFELKLIASSHAKTQSAAKQISKVTYATYTVEDHLTKYPSLSKLFFTLQENIFALESSQKIEEIPRKHYIAYRTNTNFVELQFQSNRIKIFLDIPVQELTDPKGLARDVSQIGHFGTGTSEIVLSSFDDLEYVVDLIEQSYMRGR